MKSTYPRKKLGEVCKVVGGGTPSTAVSKYWGYEYAWVTPKDLGQLHEVEISNTTKKITRAGLDKSSATLLPIGSVILSSRAPIGYVAINSVPMATNQGCRSFICGGEIYNRYLYYFLVASREALQANGSGSTFAEIAGSKLKQIEIPVPPITEQKRIVAKIEKGFVKLDEAARLRGESERIATELLPAALHEIFSSGESKGWEEKELANLCNILIGGTPRRGVAKYWDNGTLPWVSIADLTKNGKEVLVTKEKITEVGVKESNVKLIPKGTLLFSFKLSIGKLSFAGMDLYTNEAIAALQILDQKKLDKEFLFYFLQQLAFGTAHRAVKGLMLNKTKMESLKIPLPPLVEQRRIVKKLDALTKKTEALHELQSAQSADFKSLKQSILKGVFV